VRITVLGKSPAWQDAGGACSGYLVEENDTCVLLDCGNGVFAKLRQVRDYVDIDAVIVSHLHADHFFDLVPFASALTYAPRQQPMAVDRRQGTDTPARPALHVPGGATEALRQVCSGGGMPADHVERAFALREYAVTDALEIGPLRVRFQRVPHFVATHAVEIAGATGRMTFGADHGPSQDLVDFASGTDLLLLEATLPRPEPAGERGHLTPAEAGDHAARADAGRLVLTHISDELDLGWARDEAAGAFAGPVEVAAEGAVFEV
jgi:ribonuclease BN (tRNA processing enzyme)